ncbi:hypothetical protein ABGB19_10095 [Mycobacterium sp. B14F4]|uniref:hypothetical protein n=1 Tax=Mycobacterium sp. B14F4 TaxID=3153565 RepID=UPI00325CD5DE
MAILETLSTVITSSLSAVAGGIGGLFALDAPVRQAELVFDDDARLPGGTDLLLAGRRLPAVVRIAPPTEGEAIRTVCVKLPDVYGPGRDQDFLLASSADGVPLHHATLPAKRTDERLFSSLWLYLAGVSPVLFGVRATDSGFRFLISGVLGRFHAVGGLVVGDAADIASGVRFDARNSGGGIRPLPPVMFYRG